MRTFSGKHFKSQGYNRGTDALVRWVSRWCWVAVVVVGSLLGVAPAVVRQRWWSLVAEVLLVIVLLAVWSFINKRKTIYFIPPLEIDITYGVRAR